MATAVRPQPVEASQPGGTAAPPVGPNGTVANNAAVDPNSPRSPATRNVRAEAMLDAHRQRVEMEANAYLVAEIRKAEARAATALTKIEQKRMKEEARALDIKKREEAKAEQIIRNAEIKAEKIMANAKEEAARMKAHANEECERLIAESHVQIERERAVLEENKNKELAELVEKVESMKAAGEFPIVVKKGVIGRMKDKVHVH